MNNYTVYCIQTKQIIVNISTVNNQNIFSKSKHK